MNKRKLDAALDKIFTVWMYGLFIALPVVLVAGTVIVKLPTQTVDAVNIISPMERSRESIPCENIDSYINTYEYITYDDNIETHTDDSVEISIVTEPIIEENLEEKYAAIFDWMASNNNCDFGTEQLTVLNEYCEEYEVPMELMLALISHESGFISSAMSDNSTAAGYCQVIKSTAEETFEEDLCYGDYDVYNHDYIMTSNWALNLEIGVSLMRNNYEENYQSWEHAVYAYHGHHDYNKNLEYFQYINVRMFELFGLSIHEL